ncbi:hypothetical protein ACFWXA_30735 [Streptomyces atroolivaceus]|uniref:hypothetical protein n=1 Tax=Streptomyces atroolivaceus TaxID=66869 RepID=UPI00364D69F2
MDILDGDQALREHLDRNPEAQRAALHDPQYAADVHRLRTVLGHLDAALAAEGLGDEARQRVATRLVTDCLGTDEANERMRARTEAVKKLMEQSVVHVDAETARRLLEQGVPSVSAP